ncbi:MAG: hypothetical protein ACOC2H_03080 [Spirochaetota bacterium]
MEIQTAWGVTWRVASTQEILIALLVFFIVLLFFLILHLYIKSNRDVSHEYQYILFKAKSKGLTNFQYKILRGMTEMLRLKHPSLIVSSPELYEKSIGRFIRFLTSRDEAEHSLLKIFKDIVITYEKMYKDISHKRPLETLTELPDGHLIYFYTDDNHFFLGKIISNEADIISLELFRKPADIRSLSPDTVIHCFFWRPGDAEYYFDSRIRDTSEQTFHIARPESFTRGQEVRLPYINVIIPCTLIFAQENDQQETEQKQIEMTIYKLSEQEIIIRSSKELAYSNEYTIEFTISDFTIQSPAIVISDNTVVDKGVFYYTFKITQLTDAARQVIRSYIYEHL